MRRPKIINHREDKPNWGIIVAFTATVIALMQAYLMKEQLTSSDRYNAFREATNNLQNLCMDLDKPPLTRGINEYYFRDEYGRRYVSLALDATGLPSTSSEEVTNYTKEIANSRKHAITSLIQLRYWIKSGKKLNALNASLQYIEKYYSLVKNRMIVDDKDFWAHMKNNLVDCYNVQIFLTGALFDDYSIADSNILEIQTIDDDEVIGTVMRGGRPYTVNEQETEGEQEDNKQR